MSTKIETLDLSGGDNSGMVPIQNNNNNIVPKPEEKNVSKEQKTMDFTPIDDVMGVNDLSGASLAQDPRMAAPPGQPPARIRTPPTRPLPGRGRVSGS